MPDKFKDYVEHSQANLDSGRAIYHKDGKVSTVYGKIVEIDGKQVLIPTIWDGQELSTENAVSRAMSSGKDWPTFDYVEDARREEDRIKNLVINKQVPQTDSGRDLRKQHMPMRQWARERDEERKADGKMP